MAKGDWVSVTREHPCPICGKSDNCKLARDGGAAWCGRVEQGSIQQNAGGQFLHQLRHRDADRNRDGSPPWPRRSEHKPKPEAKWPTVKTDEANVSSPPPPRDWGISALIAFDNQPAEEKRQELATALGVDAEALHRLGVGWTHCHGWTFPERDATGRVIGINCRSATGKKKRRNGCKIGLTFDPDHWFESTVDPSRVYLVEGGSDTAVLMSHGMSVVGRPNNLAGVKLLGELLKAVPPERVIVVMGENDKRSHEELSATQQRGHKLDCSGCSKCWPGWFGATRIAEQLALILGREIAWVLPPDGAKDVRDWFNQPDFGTEATS